MRCLMLMKCCSLAVSCSNAPSHPMTFVTKARGDQAYRMLAEPELLARARGCFGDVPRRCPFAIPGRLIRGRLQRDLD